MITQEYDFNISLRPSKLSLTGRKLLHVVPIEEELHEAAVRSHDFVDPTFILVDDFVPFRLHFVYIAFSVDYGPVRRAMTACNFRSNFTSFSR